jgi:hypothetical protein
VGGLSAAEAGLVLVPSSLIGIAAAPLIGRLVDRWEPAWLLPVGLAAVGLSLFVLSLLDSESSIVLHVLPGLILIGFGYAAVTIPAKVVAVNGAAGEKVGAVSALVSVSAKLGAGLGVAASSALFHAFSAGNVEQSLQARGASVRHPLFEELVNRYLGDVHVRAHLEHSVDPTQPDVPGIGLLVHVVDDGFVASFNNMCTVAAAAVLASAVAVVVMLRFRGEEP